MCHETNVRAILSISIQSHAQDKAKRTWAEASSLFSTLGRHLDKAGDATYSVSTTQLRGLKLQTRRAKPHFAERGSPCLSIYGFVSSLGGFKVPSTLKSNPLHPGCLRCERQRAQFTVTAWCAALFFSCRGGGLGVHALCQSACYLGVVGTRRSLQVNKILCQILLDPPPTLSLFLYSVFFPLLMSSLHPFSFFPTSHQAVAPPSPCSPCGLAPAVPGKSWLWYPRKTSQRASGKGGGGGRKHPAQHIYSTVDSFSPNIQRNNACGFSIFFFMSTKPASLWPTGRPSPCVECLSLPLFVKHPETL